VPATRHSGKRPFPECQGQGTRGRGSLPRVLGLGTRGRAFPIFFKRFRCAVKCNFSFSCAFLPRVQFFPECNSSPSATLGEDCLPRVPDFWHSGNIASPVVAGGGHQPDPDSLRCLLQKEYSTVTQAALKCKLN
jgi:hypothetical protein